jgi:hypothetical protein
MAENDVQQFFNRDTGHKPSENFARTDRAIYRLARTDADGKPIKIAVECVSGGGNVPRNATSFRSLQKEIDLDGEFESVVGMADSVLTALKKLRPGEVEVEFGVELGGEMGIPLVTKGEAKANFKVTLKWKNSEKE